ncbi:MULTISPECIES: DUF6434 domain-containing protein [unclassified Roseovarius]|uniref:DUF6434 domain-containing protein n=1 Tax=unclassified Roseovarius TaxID=2614913 RepID=UPI002740060D|nr:MULTISPECIES: DUF6434 domain-containing protein [unclassified Roseovarius]
MTPGLDWHSAALDDDTVIDRDYRNTQNVRRYFRSRIGEDFSMNRPFMAWLKESQGKTLGTACQVWRDMRNKQT